MPSRNRAARGLALAGVALLAACATDRPTRGGRAVSDTPVKIGAPYRAGGRMWVPADDRGYDAVGYASWYGGAHAGRPTANGERFDPRGISAAHPTLPLPSYVEVTALDSGRTILTRVNDRGPFVASRIIDLSAGAARALGIERQGVARVRVRRVQPPEADRIALRAGRAARARPDTNRAMLASLAARFGNVTDTRLSPAGAAQRGATASSGGATMQAGMKAAAPTASVAILSGVPARGIVLPLSLAGMTAGSTTEVAREPIDFSKPSGAARHGVAASSGGAAMQSGMKAAAHTASVAILSGVPARVTTSPLSPAGMTTGSATEVAREAIDFSVAPARRTAHAAAAPTMPSTGTATSRASVAGTDPIGGTDSDATGPVTVPQPRASALPPSPSGPAASFYVQVAALDDADRADGLAGALAAIGPAAATAVGSRWQVRLGPYADAASARSALARARRAGYQEARIVRDSAQ